jgi:tetratricopeptide (TPR) repeat protein
MFAIHKKTQLFLILCLAGSSWNALANPGAWEQSQQFEAKGEYATAAALLEPLLQSGDSKEFGYLRYGWLNYLQGRHDVAISAYGKALQLNPQSIDARLGVSLPLLAQSRWQDAAQHLKQVLAVSPWDYTSHVRLMITEEGLQKWDVLVHHAGELNRRYPSDATILVYLARAHAWLGHKDKAKQAYQQVLVRIPNHAEGTRYLQSAS